MHVSYSLSLEERYAIRSVIKRRVPALKAVPGKLKLESVKQENDRNVFETESSGGTLTASGSRTAHCRGFDDFLKTNGLGMAIWDNKGHPLMEKSPLAAVIPGRCSNNRKRSDR